MAIKWIVFDLSGIVLTDGLATAAKIIAAKYGLDPENIKRYLVGEPAKAYRIGDEEPEVFWNKFQVAYPTTDYKEVRRIFFESYEAIPSAVDFIGKIPKEFRLASFSYSPPDRAEYLSKKFQFEKLFEKSIFSNDLNASKFDPEAYEKLAEFLGSPVSQVLMIDDRKEFVEASLNAGLPTILFTGFGKLEHELAAHGVNLWRRL